MKLLKAMPLFALLGCSAAPVPTPPTWEPPSYNDCELKIINAPPSDIGITVLHTSLKHRYDDFSSMRTHLVFATGETFKVAAVHNYETSDILAGFDDSGRLLMNRIWEDPKRAMLEEMFQSLMPSSDSYRADVLAITPVTNEIINLTKDSESFYNVGGFILPGHKIGYGALIDSEMRPHSMLLDGTNKEPLAATDGFAYGFNSSPDGNYYAFHSHYKVYIGNYNTGEEFQVSTPCSFNFLPVWSPDSKHIAFFCGADNNGPDVWISDLHGTASFLSDRGGYSGTAPIIDGPDFHGGGSDNVAWTDDNTLVFAANKSGNIELFAMDIATKTKVQLTSTDAGSTNYYPTVYGKNLLFNSNRTGRRNSYYMDLMTRETKQITDVPAGCGIFNVKWRFN